MSEHAEHECTKNRIAAFTECGDFQVLLLVSTRCTIHLRCSKMVAITAAQLQAIRATVGMPPAHGFRKGSVSCPVRG